MIEIKNIQGNVIYSTEINKGAKRKFQLMKEDYITLPFSLKAPLNFELGSYVDIEEGLFEVVDLQKPTLNNSTGGYDYQLRLDAYYWKWKNKIFKFTPEVGGQEASWSLTASLDVHLGVFLKNLKALGYNYRGIEFNFSIDATVESKAMPLTYNNTNMIDALSAMAEAWQCEWWIEEDVICFGRCENGDEVDFEIGKNVDEMTSSASQSLYATRLYVFGSTRNIPSNYRSVDESMVVGGVVQKRLMLPKGTPYLDAYDNMSEEEAIEEVVIIEEVYPKTEGKIDSVSTYESSANNEDGTITTETFYRFKDNGINFSSSYILEGEELKVKFTSGSLNGMEFGLVFNPENKVEKLENGSWNPEAQLFEVVVNDDYGRKLPDATLNPKVGDTYILIGWDSTKIADLGLVSKAERELLVEGRKILDKRMIDPNTYNCRMFSDYMYGLDEQGYQDYRFAKKFQIGHRVNLINSAYFNSGRQSRIVGYEYNLDIPYDSPIYIVGETLAYSRIGALENKIDSIILNGVKYEGGSVNLSRYLRKDKDDRSKGKIASDVGFEVGTFNEGMIGGRGAKMYMDENGKSVLEIDKIHGREELVVPVITFNTIEVVSGDKANTFAFGIIKEVDTETQTATLDLLSDEYGTLKEMDILRGVFHNINGGNDTETKADSNGFLQYSGFFTSYFTPTKILSNKAGEMSFRYALQEDEWGNPICPHPCAGMKFYAYGNFTDSDRQSITYENRDYKRRLVKMNSWAINPTRNIAMQDGKLDNLTIGGFEMSGYGTFQTNSYFTGVMIQFTPDQLEDLKGEDAYSIELSSHEGIVKVDSNGNVIGSLMDSYNVVTDGMNVVTRDMNVVTKGFRLKTIVQAARGKTPLYYSTEIGAGSYVLDLRMVGCEAYILNGVVVVSKITDIKNCRVTIIVNCEGKYAIEKEYHINGVYDGDATEVIYSKNPKPKKPRNEHPYEDDKLEDGAFDDKGWNHEVDDDNNWMAMAVKKDDKWGEWQLSPLKGFEYKIYPETTTIGRTMTGSFNPSSLELTCYRVAGGERTAVEANWGIQRYNGTDWVDTDFKPTGATDSISYAFPNEEHKAYRFLANPLENSDMQASSTATIVDDGMKGQIARYCGMYKTGTTYVWDEDYRDIVIYDGNAYQVKSFGDKITNTIEEGFKEDQWEQASKFSFVAMDTALISGANIAGFTFTVLEYRDGVPYGVLASANNEIVLDAAKGKLSCKGADLDGNLNVGSIAYKTLEENGVLNDYSFGLGGNIYTLPVLEKGQNVELRLLYPRVDSRMASTLFMIKVDERYESNGTENGKASIVVPDEGEVWAKIETSAVLKENILYTVFGYCDSRGYTKWFIGGSYGSTASIPIGGSNYGPIEYNSQEGVWTFNGDIRLRLKNDTLNRSLLFGDANNCYLKEDGEDHLLLYSKNGIKLKTDSEKMVEVESNGLQLNGGKITFNKDLGYFMLDGDLVVSGGVTFFSDGGNGNRWILDVESLDEIVPNEKFKVYSANVTSMIAEELKKVKTALGAAENKIAAIKNGLNGISSSSSAAEIGTALQNICNLL